MPNNTISRTNGGDSATEDPNASQDGSTPGVHLNVHDHPSTATLTGEPGGKSAA